MILKPLFIVPVTMGILLSLGSFFLFRKRRIPRKSFGISIIMSILLIISPVIYIVLVLIKGYFGIVYTYVLGFALAIVLLTSLMIYMILLTGEIRKEMKEIWQEIAIVKKELEDE